MVDATDAAPARDMSAGTRADGRRKALLVLLGPRAAGKKALAESYCTGQSCIEPAMPSIVSITPEDLGSRVMPCWRKQYQDIELNIELCDLTFGPPVGLLRAASVVCLCIPYGAYERPELAEYLAS